MEKFRSMFHGKAASYLVNAYVDAQIEEALIYYVKKSKIKTGDKEVKQRVKDIVKKTSKTDKKQKLIVKAFAYKWVNGYANYWYSKIFYQVIKIDFPIKKKLFKGFGENFFDHLKKIVLAYPEMVEEYAKNLVLNVDLTKKEIRKELLEVQELNISINAESAKKIEKGKTDVWKIKQLVKWSKEDRHPEVFLESAQKTQLSASGWDRIYSLLLGYL